MKQRQRGRGRGRGVEAEIDRGRGRDRHRGRESEAVRLSCAAGNRSMLRGTEPPEQLREYVLRMSSNKGANNDEEQERAVAALCHVELESPSELISQVILTLSVILINHLREYSLCEFNPVSLLLCIILDIVMILRTRSQDLCLSY